MQIVTLDNQAEADAFLTTFVQKAALFDSFTHIGAISRISKSTTEWYWAENSKKVSFNMKWANGKPNNNGDCLGLQKTGKNYEFVDNKCSDGTLTRFICQSVVFV